MLSRGVLPPAGAAVKSPSVGMAEVAPGADEKWVCIIKEGVAPYPWKQGEHGLHGRFHVVVVVMMVSVMFVMSMVMAVMMAMMVVFVVFVHDVALLFGFFCIQSILWSIGMDCHLEKKQVSCIIE